MRTYKKVLVETTAAEKIVCNFCGKEIESNGYDDMSFRAEKTWGYGSKWDGERHAVDICVSCWDMLTGKMAIKPNTETERS